MTALQRAETRKWRSFSSLLVPIMPSFNFNFNFYWESPHFIEWAFSTASLKKQLWWFYHLLRRTSGLKYDIYIILHITNIFTYVIFGILPDPNLTRGPGDCYILPSIFLMHPHKNIKTQKHSIASIETGIYCLFTGCKCQCAGLYNPYICVYARCLRQH